MPTRRLLYTFLSLAIILSGTFVAIQYAKGNFRLTRQGFVPETGLLSANSFPPGAEVVIDGRLVTATDDTIYLQPGQYTVEVLKDGYWPWKKNLSVERELVTQTNAQLFPVAPSLNPFTFAGVQNVTPSPDGQKLIYYTASASAQNKNGLYLIELTDSPLSLQRGPRHLAEDVPSLNLAEADIIWSPDSNEAMLLADEKEVLLDLDTKNNLLTLPDISFSRPQILSQWEEEMYIRERQFLSRFPEEIVQIATQSAKNVYISPDKKRLLYTAVNSVAIPEDIAPPVPSTNSQPQERELQPGSIYVYDREEDTNFKVGEEATASATPTKQLLATDLYNRQALSLESSPSAFRRLQASTSAQTANTFNVYHTPLFTNTFQWYPDSRHLIYTLHNRIQIMEYDGANDTTVYSGPYSDEFVYPWPDGSKLLILTSFSPEVPNNLYGIELK
jgi:hypothetical protein